MSECVLSVSLKERERREKRKEEKKNENDGVTSAMDDVIFFADVASYSAVRRKNKRRRESGKREKSEGK